METGCCVSGGSRRSKAASVRLCPCSKISLSMRVEYSKRGIVTCEERRQVVVQFDKLASQTRDYCVARNATLRAARPDPSLRQERLFRMTIKPHHHRMPAGGGSRELLRSEEHTSELQSRLHLVCRLLLEKKK